MSRPRFDLPVRRFAPTLAALLALALVAGPALAAPVRFEVDPVHSSVVFKIGHLNAAYVWGRFNEFSGSFTIDANDAAASSVSLEVKTASVDTGNDKRDQHLRSPDFFNAQQFPAITFKSRSVRATIEGSYEVTGDLSLHGVTKSVTVVMKKVGEATHERFGHRMGFEGTLTLKRSDYGMTTMLDIVGDEVTLTIAVEGQKKE